ATHQSFGCQFKLPARSAAYLATHQRWAWTTGWIPRDGFNRMHTSYHLALLSLSFRTHRDRLSERRSRCPTDTCSLQEEVFQAFLLSRQKNSGKQNQGCYV